MNNARTVSTNGVVAAVAWASTVGFLLLAIGLMISGHWKASILVAETACCMSAWSAVRHLRCYAAAISRQIEERTTFEADIRRLQGVPDQRGGHQVPR